MEEVAARKLADPGCWSMIEVLESEYVTMARLKGLQERTVIWRHAVPNAIVPAIQVTALQLVHPVDVEEACEALSIAHEDLAILLIETAMAGWTARRSALRTEEVAS